MPAGRVCDDTAARRRDARGWTLVREGFARFAKMLRRALTPFVKPKQEETGGPKLMPNVSIRARLILLSVLLLASSPFLPRF